MTASTQRTREIAHYVVKMSGSVKVVTVSLSIVAVMEGETVLMELMSWTVQHKHPPQNAPVLSSLAPLESHAAYLRERSVTECRTARMGSKSWIAPAAEILNLPAVMELALTLGGNVMEDQIVEINQTKMFVNVEDVDWVSFDVEVVTSAYPRGEGATGDLTAGTVAMRLAVPLQMGST